MSSFKAPPLPKGWRRTKTPEETAALWRKCPHCGAGEGACCWTIWGDPAKRFHKARMNEPKR